MKKCALLFLCIAMLLILAVPGFAETPPTAPTIGTQPVNLSLAYGYTNGNVLSVSASAADGYTLSYQWYSNTNASNEGGTPIDGATEESYAVPEGKNAGTTEYYYCVVTAKRTDNGQTAETVSNAVVVSISKATPEVTAPTASATYRMTLSEVWLNNPTDNLPGTWTWATDNGINPNQTAVGTIGTHDFRAKFTPEDTANYCETTMDVTVTVGKATPKLTIDGFSVPYGHPVSVKSRCNSDGEVTYVFYKSGGETETNTEDGAETEGGPPRNAGTYNIVASVAETSNYFSREETLADGCVITPAPNPVVLRSPVTVKRGSSYNLSGLVSGAKGTVRFALKESKDGYSLSGENNKTLTLDNNADSSCTITVTADGTVDGKSNYETFSGEITVNATDLLPQDSFGFADVAQDKTYGDGDFTVAATGAADGSSVTYLSSDPAVATVEEDTGNVTIKKAGTATITATAGATDTYASAAASYKLTVNRKPVTISGIMADDMEYNAATAQQGMTLNTAGAKICGKVDGDVLTVEEAIGMCEEADAGKNKMVTISRITLGGSSAGNYTLAEEGQQKTTTVNIYPKPVIVSGITAVDKPYDGTTEATLDYTNVSIKDEKDESVSGGLTVTATGEFADKNVGDNKTVTISDFKFVGVGAENYTLAESGRQTTASASITAKEVGLIWTNTRLTYTGLPQAPTAQATGVANGDEIGVSVSGAQTNVGTGYTATAIGLTGDKAGNYKLPGNKAVTFKISKATPDITVDPTASAIIYGQTLTDSNLSGGAGSVPGSFKWKDQTVAPVVSNSQTTEYDVVFTPTDTDNYYQVECKVKLSVEQKEVGLTWSGTALTYNGSAQAPTATATGLLNNDEIGVTISGDQTNAGTYTATASSLTGDKAGNYKLPEANTASFAIGQKEVGLTWGETALTYKGTAQAPAAEATGLVNNDEIGVSVSGAQTNVGTGYTATASALTGDKAGNYKLPGENTTTTFSIGKAPLTVTANPKTITYGDAPANDGVTYSGLVNSEPESVLGGTLAYAYSYAQYGNVGNTYTITPSGLTSDNYDITFYSGTLTVNPKPVTVTAASESWTYDGNAHSNNTVTLTSGSLLTGDSLVATASCSVTNVADTVAGNNPIAAGYKIMRGGTEDVTANYAITTQAGTLTINPKPVTITDITATNRDYNGEKTVALSGGTVSGNIGNDNVTVDLSAAIGTMDDANVGENKAVTITGARLGGTDAANYTPSAQPTGVTVTINKAANPAKVTGTASVIRDGNTIDLADNVTLNGATGEVSYAIDGEANGCSMSGSVLTSGTNTGSVTVNVMIAEHGNYLALAATPIQVTITDKQIQTINAENLTVSYGDADRSVTATTDGNGAISYAVKTGSEDYIGVDAASGALTIKKVGSAIVVVTVAETLTYKQATKEVTVTIHKANAVPATVTENDRTYDGTEKPLVTVTGTVTGGTMQYALGSATEATRPYTTSIPTATNAGTYYVWYKVEESDNYKGTEPDKAKVTISPTDKTGLNAAIAEAETYYNSIRDDYADIAATLKTAIDIAKAVAGNDNTTEKAVADAISALNGAVDTAKGGVKKADDEAAAKKVVDLINALPENAGVGDKAAVEAARAACDALTDDQKALVPADVLAKLTTAEAQVQAAEAEAAKQAADKAAANSVIDLINALPASAGVDEKDAVEAARTAYDALTPDQKTLVPADVLAKLTAAEDQVMSAEEAARKIDISKCKITVKDLTYTGKTVTAKAMKATVTVKYGKKTLKYGTDYSLSYDKKRKAVGPAAVIVVGKGNYTGSKEMDFNIIPKDTAFTKLTGGQQQITLKWKNPQNITGYQIEYSLKEDFTNSDKARIDKAETLTATIKQLKANTTYYVRIRTYKTVSKKDYYSAWSKADTVKTGTGQISISKCKITVKGVTYTGNAVTAKTMQKAVTVKYGKKTLEYGMDYTLSYDKKLKAIGPAAVTVKGEGNYTGSRKMTFNIIPKGTAFSRVTGGKQSITLNWKDQENITGYQIQYGLKKDFKDAEKVNIPMAKILTTTIGDLEGKKTYYVRIRTYTTLEKKNYYSAWSKAETVETTGAKNNSSISSLEASMNVGEELDLKETLEGSSWESSDETVATVSADGIVKALAKGEVIVTALDANGAQITVVITVSDENVLELDDVVPLEINGGLGEDIPLDEELELMLG